MNAKDIENLDAAIQRETDLLDTLLDRVNEHTAEMTRINVEIQTCRARIATLESLPR